MTATKHLSAMLYFLLASNLYAQTGVATPPLPRYPGIRTQFNQNYAQALTNEQRLDLYRQTVAKGRYSGRPMLTRMFDNFAPGKFILPANTPGLSGVVRLLASDNRNVVIGAARTLRYSMSLQADGRYDVVGLNQQRVNAAGKTDADIVFRHKSTGLQARIEVKNMSPTSQRANLPKIKSQLLKMAQDARISGEMQVWANRQPAIPEVRSFADKLGVKMVDRLRTGSTNLRPGDQSFTNVLNDLEKDFIVQSRMSALAGSVKAGMGAFMAYEALQQLQYDVATFRDTKGDWFRLGQHGSMLLAGSGYATAGGAQLVRTIPPLANKPYLISITKWGGRLGLVGAIFGEGFLVSQYVISGDLTERQFWHGQASLGAGMAGGLAGGWVGAKAGAAAGAGIGAVVGTVIPGAGTAAGAAVGAPIGGLIGAIGGGIGGGYTAAHLAGRGVDHLNRLKDAEQHERYVQFLLVHYKSR